MTANVLFATVGCSVHIFFDIMRISEITVIHNSIKSNVEV
jgi:hypothetical protein